MATPANSSQHEVSQTSVPPIAAAASIEVVDVPDGQGVCLLYGAGTGTEVVNYIIAMNCLCLKLLLAVHQSFVIL